MKENYKTKQDRWYITGRWFQKCWGCNTITKRISFFFDAPMCSKECDDKSYHSYMDSLQRAEVKTCHSGKVD